MKRLRILGVFIIGLFLPVFVHAASGSFNLSGPSTAVVGNTITVNLSISSSQPLGAWDLDLSYDKSFLQLTSSTAEGGGTHMMSYASNSSTRSTSYRFTFKALKSGSTIIKVSSYDIAAFDESSMSMSGGSKSIRIQTQAELEASYSDDATLRALSVEGYEITPEFDKKTYEYSLEVENTVEKVNIIATKSNGNARVEGAGEVELKEGNNKIDINVTAQKGNTLTYTININRKELNPIAVTINNKNYTIVRRVDDLPKYSGFVETTVNYNGEEIPALISEAIDKTIVGVKDESGNIYTYIFNNGKFEGKYVELKSNEVSIYLIEKDSVPYKGFTKENIKIVNNEIAAFKYKNLTNYYLVYGMDLSTGKEGYYLYDANNNTFQLFDEELFDALVKENNLYLYMFIGSLAVILVCIIIILSQLKKKDRVVKKVTAPEVKKEEKPQVKKEEKEEVKEVKKEEKISENKKLDMLFEDIEEPKKTKKKKNNEEI